jgi:hypothetical protein
MIRNAYERLTRPVAIRGERNPWFNFFQRLGLHVTPLHYYQPIPDTRALDGAVWERPSKLVGLNMNDAAQLRLLERIHSHHAAEYDAFPLEPTATPHEFYYNNSYFRSVDPELLYSIVRDFRPRRIIEIGSGITTFLSAQAIRRNQQDDSAYICNLTAIEPFPNKTIRTGFPGLTALRSEPVQKTPLSLFEELEKNDILFIDSTHVLRIGSDVQYEILEIIPRLKPGVLVHLHDIFLPKEYPKEWVFKRHRFWTEQYVLQAFLAFNDAFEILWAGTYMHLNHSRELAAAFASYRRKLQEPDWVGPGSLWMRRTR